MTNTAVPTPSHDAAARQFEIRTPSGIALLRYVPAEGALDLVHTEVPEEIEGTGYGAALVEAALAYAKQRGLKVIPSCPFVRTYMKRHPEHAALAGSAATG